MLCAEYGPCVSGVPPACLIWSSLHNGKLPKFVNDALVLLSASCLHRLPADHGELV